MTTDERAWTEELLAEQLAHEGATVHQGETEAEEHHEPPEASARPGPEGQPL